MSKPIYGLHIKKSPEIINEIKFYYEKGGISCIQFFLENAQRRIGSISKEKQKQLIDVSDYCKKHKITMFVHAPYSINIGQTLTNPEHKNLDWWISSIVKELKMADKLSVSAVVLHVGKAMELDEKVSVNNMLLSLKLIYSHFKDSNVELLLETPAGQGTELLSNFDDFLNFYKKLDEKLKKKIFVCVDTCHIFSAGVQLKTKEDANSLMKKIDNTIGLSSVHLIHLNDSELPFNSRRDRHETIGKGYIGLEPLLQIYKIATKNGIPVLLETPSKRGLDDLMILKNAS